MTSATPGLSLFGGTAGSTPGTTSLFSGFGSTTPGGTGLLGTTPGVQGSLMATIDSPRPYGSLPPLPALSDSDVALASAAQTKAALKPKHYKLTARASPAAGRSLGYYQGGSRRISFMGEIDAKKQPSPLTGAATPDSFRRKLILEPDDNVSMPEVAEFRVTPLAERYADKRTAVAETPYAAVAAPEPDQRGAMPETPAPLTERERPGMPSVAITTPSGRMLDATPGGTGLYPNLPGREISSAGASSQADTPAAVAALPGRTPKKPIVERRAGQVLSYESDQPETARYTKDYEQFYREVERGGDGRGRRRGDQEVDEKILPTLTEPDYYIKPDLADLRSMTADELAQVGGVVVGRRGYGCIEFLEPVDLREVDLNQVIVIDRHQITVFPDKDTKPPRGQGLNVPARLTIEEAWPESRDATSLAEYEAFLRKRGSRSKKQRFVAYDHQRGAWTFDVPGF